MRTVPTAEQAHGIFEFSLSKFHKHLDRLGHALDKSYDIVDETDVRTYVHWDPNHNTLLTMGPLILTQSPVGVAIGGFLSSWEAELWCMCRESLSLHQNRADTINRWCTALQATSADTEICTTLTLTLLQPAPFNTMHSHAGVADLDRMCRRLAAATLTPPTVTAEGYMHWWHPLDTIWGFFENHSVIVPILSPLAYDGDWDGRNGALIQTTPRREHHILKQFLRNVPTLALFRGEAITGWREWIHPELHGTAPQAPTPAVFLTRYKDNNYILYASIPNTLLPTLKHATYALLQAIYGIPLKWEPARAVTTCGVCQLTITTQGPHMWRKGIGLMPDAPQAEWHSLAPAHAPNAQMTLSARLPTLLNDSLIYALHHKDVSDNLRSLAWGLGYLHYPKQWWEARVISYLNLHDRIPYVSMRQFLSWVRQGRATTHSAHHVLSVP